MTRIGIDNGADGAIVALDKNYEVVFSEVMPVLNVGVARKGKRGTKRVLDMRSLSNTLKELKSKDKNVFAVLEHAQPFPKEGVSTSFNSGAHFGAIQMALICADIPHEIIRPKIWQKIILSGVEGVDTKVRSVLKIQRRLPKLDLLPGKKRKPHHGISDAACMALYAHVLSPYRLGG